MRIRWVELGKAMVSRLTDGGTTATKTASCQESVQKGADIIHNLAAADFGRS
jgi:hypothetical protein